MIYPIGTTLTMRRPSQVELYIEIFGDENLKTFCVDEPGDLEGVWFDGYIPKLYAADEGGPWSEGIYRVTVTPENQKWLSPAPCARDLAEVYSRMPVHDEYIPIDCTYGEKGHYYADADFIGKDDIIKNVMIRRYPNGIRAPLIQFDEVME